jgi:ABC-type anion transport system duplicated permease subunit
MLVALSSLINSAWHGSILAQYLSDSGYSYYQDQ